MYCEMNSLQSDKLLFNEPIKNSFKVNNLHKFKAIKNDHMPVPIMFLYSA